jgi:molybdate/tungstate transport system substrate-binding protein
MTEKRPGATRRAFLGTAGIAAFAGLAGCTGGSTGLDDEDQSTTVAVLAAGSLQHALENGLQPAVDVPDRKSVV